jgi:hypothetical protein
MGWLGIYGFESRNALRDGFTIQSGTPTYSTDVPVGGSSRSMTASNNVNNVVLRDAFSANAAEFWIHARVKPKATNNGQNHWIGWAANTGLRGYIRFQNNTHFPQVLVNGVLVETGSVGLDHNVWNRLHVHVKIATVGGFVRVYKDGDLTTAIAEFNGDTDPFTEGVMDEVYLKIYGGGAGVWIYDDIVYMNPLDGTGITDPNNMLNIGIRPHYPTSDGTHTAWTQQGTPGGTGDFEHVDEVQPADSDYIRATAAAQKSTFGFDDVPDGVVIGARVKARVLRGDTTAGSNIRTISRQGGADYTGTTQAAPASGDIDEIYDLAPDGSAWDTTKFNGVEWGVESVT